MPQDLTAPRPACYDRQTLLAECVELFNRHGYEATSMGMLAAHLGISKSAIYHHVESKEAILDHAVTEALDALEACLDDVVKPAGPMPARRSRRPSAARSGCWRRSSPR